MSMFSEFEMLMVVISMQSFFNDGSLSGDELTEQVYHVIGCCELVGLKVFGICSDAGGSNKKLYSDFLDEKNFKQQNLGWLKEECISIENPTDPSRKIYLFYCSVHGLKAIRNCLLNSMPGQSKCLILDGANFGWKQFEDMWQNAQEIARNSQCVDPLKKIRPTAIFPDKFSKMNVNDAKSVFSYETLIHLAAELAKDLGCMEILKTESFTFGYEAEKIDWIANHLHIYYNTIIEQTHMNNKKKLALKERISHFRYAAVVHGIYISRFLNNYASLVWDESLEVRHQKNLRLYLPKEKERMLKYLQFYDEWLKEAQNRKVNLKDDEWVSRFPASVTITNLKILICGFFGYAECLLSNQQGDNKLNHVSFLHSSQSPVENLFSQLRAFNRDRADMLAKGMLGTSLNLKWKNDSKINNNKMYTNTDVSVEGENEQELVDSFLYSTNDLKRSTDFKNILKIRKEKKPFISNPSISIFGANNKKHYMSNMRVTFQKVKNAIGETENYQHFSDILFDEPEIHELFKLFLLGPGKIG